MSSTILFHRLVFPVLSIERFRNNPAFRRPLSSSIPDPSLHASRLDLGILANALHALVLKLCVEAISVTDGWDVVACDAVLCQSSVH